MKINRIAVKKLCLYVGTLLSSIFIGWVGVSLLNELTGALGILLCLFATALPILLVVEEIRQHTNQRTTQAHPALGELSGPTPVQTFWRTWRNMALASVLIGGMIGVAAMGPRWYAMWHLPLVCLAGPLSLLLMELHAAPVVAVCVVLYGLGVAWLLWQPSRWARAGFRVLSLLWLLLGLVMAGKCGGLT